MKDDEQRQLTAAREDLVREFAGRLDPDTVRSRFGQVVDDFAGAPVRTFVPVLARRAVRRELVGQGAGH